ncbi:DUF4249 domain-containing protein [Gramella sp. GC03-9]|uniref:DUF4249 domain-containing protein n=1 Tax=Christiangramia oceanisediminis TaxID=2920386 RepID=A0A9X2IBB3_9FLAO|nr:DUF4249 domain-containing protein [Gramella oceanisediminis]MCP9199713.1 DUF4249 domain-containing protein [Gramella oceanisediminis]
MERFKTFIFLVSLFCLFSCEDVIDVDLDESEPRLVVDASIIWKKGTLGQEQQIILSLTTPYYEEAIQPVEDATVKVISGSGKEFNFIHIGNGVYQNLVFEPVLNETYQLELIYDDELYTATESLVPVTDIDFVEQSASGGFSGEDIEIKAFYTDPADEENYYLFKFYNDDISLEFYEDEFTNGNQIFGYYSNEDIERGDEIQIEMEGISQDYFEYLFILRSQIGDSGGGPFETQPATVRGNVINRSDNENFPFGYFRLSQADTTSYTVE